LTAMMVVPLLVSLLANAGCGAGRGEGSIRVLYAGSLILPFAEIERQFEALHPEIDINGEAHGSIQVLRHVSDVHESADVLISADSQLIPLLLYSSDDPDTGRPYGSWRIDFATNEMTIAFTDQSKYADEMTADNWYEVIARPDVRLGIADPRFDANGYRALMMLKLAEEPYGKPALFFDAFDGQFASPVTVEDEGQQSVIHVPEILETEPGARIVMRA
jgi:molybdate/tungstate transport system substrate-binding protein